jgi:SOS-response transcriptional repressor LexA
MAGMLTALWLSQKAITWYIPMTAPIEYRGFTQTYAGLVNKLITPGNGFSDTPFPHSPLYAPERLLAVFVAGDSMIEEHINDGDAGG